MPHEGDLPVTLRLRGGATDDTTSESEGSSAWSSTGTKEQGSSSERECEFGPGGEAQREQDNSSGNETGSAAEERRRSRHKAIRQIKLAWDRKFRKCY